MIHRAEQGMHVMFLAPGCFQSLAAVGASGEMLPDRRLYRRRQLAVQHAPDLFLVKVHRRHPRR
jgi:hypothetical protein